MEWPGTTVKLPLKYRFRAWTGMSTLQRIHWENLPQEFSGRRTGVIHLWICYPSSMGQCFRLSTFALGPQGSEYLEQPQRPTMQTRWQCQVQSCSWGVWLAWWGRWSISHVTRSFRCNLRMSIGRNDWNVQDATRPCVCFFEGHWTTSEEGALVGTQYWGYLKTECQPFLPIYV